MEEAGLAGKEKAQARRLGFVNIIILNKFAMTLAGTLRQEPIPNTMLPVQDRAPTIWLPRFANIPGVADRRMLTLKQSVQR